MTTTRFLGRPAFAAAVVLLSMGAVIAQGEERPASRPSTDPVRVPVDGPAVVRPGVSSRGVLTELDVPGPEALQAHPTLRLYDVEDLIAEARTMDHHVPLKIESLAEFVHAFAEPRLDGRDAAMPFRGNTLVVLATADTHVWIVDFLDRLRRARGRSAAAGVSGRGLGLRGARRGLR